MDESHQRFLVRTRDELLAMANELMNRAEEIRAILQSNIITYESDDTDGTRNSYIESDEIDALGDYRTEDEDEDENENISSELTIEDSGSGETMSDLTIADYTFNNIISIDIEDSEMNDSDSDSEFSSLELTTMSLTNYSDSSDF